VQKAQMPRGLLFVVRMFAIPNQSSVAKAYQEFNEDGTMKDSLSCDRVVDVMEAVYGRDRFRYGRKKQVKSSSLLLPALFVRRTLQIYFAIASLEINFNVSSTSPFLTSPPTPLGHREQSQNPNFSLLLP
jgi:hypothetical protein